METVSLQRLANWTISACALHCIITPFAIGLLPLVGVGIFASNWFEWSMVAAAGALGGAGLGVSYARTHRDARPMAMFLAGLGAVSAAQLFLDQRDLRHVLASLAGAAAIFAAGRLNHALMHRH